MWIWSEDVFRSRLISQRCSPLKVSSNYYCWFSYYEDFLVFNIFWSIYGPQTSEVIKLHGPECLPYLVFLGFQNSKAAEWAKLLKTLYSACTVWHSMNKINSLLIWWIMLSAFSEIRYLNLLELQLCSVSVSWVFTTVRTRIKCWAWNRYYFNLPDQELAIYLCLIPTDNAVFLNGKAVDWILTNYF